MGKSKKEVQNNQKLSSRSKSEEKLGVDQDEQAMNGAYGMLETEEEDRANRMNRE